MMLLMIPNQAEMVHGQIIITEMDGIITIKVGTMVGTIMDGTTMAGIIIKYGAEIIGIMIMMVGIMDGIMIDMMHGIIIDIIITGIMIIKVAGEIITEITEVGIIIIIKVDGSPEKVEITEVTVVDVTEVGEIMDTEMVDGVTKTEDGFNIGIMIIIMDGIMIIKVIEMVDGETEIMDGEKEVTKVDGVNQVDVVVVKDMNLVDGTTIMTIITGIMDGIMIDMMVGIMTEIIITGITVGIMIEIMAGIMIIIIMDGITMVGTTITMVGTTTIMVGTTITEITGTTDGITTIMVDGGIKIPFKSLSFILPAGYPQI